MSTLPFLITKPPTTQTFDVNLVECFHGRVPNNILDLEMGIRPQRILTPNSQIAQEFLKQTKMIFHDVRKNTLQAYIEYKAWYDKKS